MAKGKEITREYVISEGYKSAREGIEGIKSSIEIIEDATHVQPLQEHYNGLVHLLRTITIRIGADLPADIVEGFNEINEMFRTMNEDNDPEDHFRITELREIVPAVAVADAGAAGPGGRDVEHKESDGEAEATNFYELADFVQALIDKNRENVKRFGESFLSHFENANEAIAVIRQFEFPSGIDPLVRVGHLRSLRNLANDYFRDEPAPSASPSPSHTPVPSATVAAEVVGDEFMERQHVVVIPSPSAMPSPSLAALNVGIEEVHPSLEELEASARSGFMGALSFVLGGSH